VRIYYRIGQFWRALYDKPAPDDLAKAQEMLTPQLMTLFSRQSPSEQAHSLSLLRRLCEQGWVHEDLMLAALLHDIGKSRYPLHLWERVLIVLAKALIPKLVKVWGSGELDFWNKPFVVAEKHASWGAEMAETAGASALTVALIRRHQEPLPITDEMNGQTTQNVIEIDKIIEIDRTTLEDELLSRLILLDDES
jgi:putative nucleotidyltransferase with HDIG domain